MNPIISRMSADLRQHMLELVNSRLSGMTESMSELDVDVSKSVSSTGSTAVKGILHVVGSDKDAPIIDEIVRGA